MTPDLVKKIKVLLAEDAYFQHQIAAMFAINQGRVSEVKNGFYDDLLTWFYQR